MTPPADLKATSSSAPLGDKGVALISIDRPGKLNALTSSMVSELAGIVEQVNKDKVLRAVTLTGNGRAFCVGSDIGEAGPLLPSRVGVRYAEDYGDVLGSLHKPAIAAVNGYAFGGGLELALACDIRVGLTERKFRCTRDQARVDWGQRPVRPTVANVGPGNAAQMVLTGDPLTPRPHSAWRLITHACRAR